MPLLVLSLLVGRQLDRLGFQALPCIYPRRQYFEDQGRLRGMLRTRLAQRPDTEVIVHPAEINDLETLEFPDSYTNGRVTEFHALRMLGIRS